MNAKISMFVICVETIIYLLLHNCMTVPFTINWLPIQESVVLPPRPQSNF